MTKAKIIAILAALMISILAGCVRAPEPVPVENLPPETYLFINPVNDTTDTVGGKQVMRWWGNDPDGEVVGYYIAVDDTSEWIWTTSTETTIIFRSESTAVIHRFFAKAVDNEGAQDPTPAFVVIPTVSTPPTIEFVYGTQPPDTTFPIATFYWEAHDDDGDETITGYLWRLDTDPEGEWHFIPAETSFVTIRNIEPGERTFVVKAIDETGVISTDSACYTWYVKPAQGHLLVVDDSDEPADDRFYLDIIEQMGVEYSIWKLDVRVPYSPYDIDGVINEMGFDVIVWFTGTEFSRFWNEHSGYSLVQSLERFLDNGHKLLLISEATAMTVGDTIEELDALLRLLHVDTLTLREAPFLLPTQSVYSVNPNYPDSLSVSELLRRFEGFEPDSLAEAIYRLPDNFEGQPAVGLRYPANSENAQLVFFSVALRKLNRNNQIATVFNYILFNEFGLGR